MISWSEKVLRNKQLLREQKSNTKINEIIQKYFDYFPIKVPICLMNTKNKY